MMNHSDFRIAIGLVGLEKEGLELEVAMGSGCHLPDHI
jgi:hypothetical protein